MPQLLHPGVYVQELPPAVRPIQGVSTSTAAFIGVTDRGPVPRVSSTNGQRVPPVMVTSLTDYSRQFGGYRQDSFLTYAVRSFFDNGGQRLYVVRVVPSDAATASLPAATTSTTPATGGTTPATGGVATSASSALPIQARNEGAWGNNIWVSLEAGSDGNSSNFSVVVMYYGGSAAADAKKNIVERHDNVTFRSSNNSQSVPANDVFTYVNSRSEYIVFTSPLTAGPTLPMGPTRFTGGSDGTTTIDKIGTADAGTGLFALDGLMDVSLVAIPGEGSLATVNAGMSYCKNTRPLQDCFFIGDVGTITNVGSARIPGTAPDVSKLADVKSFGLPQTSGTSLDRSSGDFGAVYYPWVYASDPLGTGRNPKILLPPSGFVSGIYARVDSSRGVFKAPAGALDGGVANALGPASAVGDLDQDTLNPLGINALRTVPGSGLVVWGTRTAGGDPGWRYVPVRRMAIFLRVSIFYGIQWAVFEPNDEPLWSSLRLNIRAFMMSQFRAGAFQGAKPDDAFFVQCDASTTTQIDIDNGVVNILVGFAPLKPAEFVVLKLSQKVNQSAS
jgi:phage tail sheath protein FI